MMPEMVFLSGDRVSSQIWVGFLCDLVIATLVLANEIIY